MCVIDRMRLSRGMRTVQRCTKRWTCIAKQQPGSARQKFLATYSPPIGASLLVSVATFSRHVNDKTNRDFFLWE